MRGADGKASQRGITKYLLKEATWDISIADILPGYQGTITVDLDMFRAWLPGDIRAQALARVEAVVTDWHESQGDDPRDEDYEE